MKPAAARRPAHAAVRYRVAVRDPHTHLFDVTLELDHPAPRQRLSLPVWIPGSYLVREFAQHLQDLQASADGQPLALQQTAKNTWEARPPAGCATLTLRYQVYAFDASVRTAFLDQTRGFFNPTSLCLQADGRGDETHDLEVLDNAHTAGWRLATALPARRVQPNGFGLYRAADYDELADHPVELGTFWSGAFEVRGVPHRFVVSGAPAGFDGERLLRDTQRICEANMALWHGPAGPEGQGTPPFDRYLFLLHASADGYGGLEHRQSTALICQRGDLPLRPDSADATVPKLKASDGYTTLLGLISHEYFHTWNVKRLRPREFARYDYGRENYTELLWFFEGFTSYYDDLLVHCAGLIDEATYLQLLTKTVNQVLQTPGRRVQSVAQASFDAWVKYYRIQENTPNATVSYYTKGALVALCLDLTLRAEGRTTLDAVMRALYARCDGGPMREADLRKVLKRLGGRPFDAELDAWVHGTADLPLDTLLPAHGVHWHADPAPLAQRLGVRVGEQQGLVLKNVLRGGAAEAAGLAAGDEWLGLETTAADGSTQAWRVRKLDEVALHARGAQRCVALVARDGRLLRCPLDWPAPATVVRLSRASVGADDTPRRWLAE
ncbi:M61 family metallopeptidase [Aquabacterium sp. A08]|uniref:M61 family metallopeptidase n=1 Tax=Aquabacterium sp. A08 TaxID=2718532 RepID=UPI00141E350D|nr:M61 family metallopeptidase [Aquabacterium sp. A08]NIC42977.1 M61 family metallopeptidase [Aquabacterium sp. A08]